VPNPESVLVSDSLIIVQNAPMKAQQIQIVLPLKHGDKYYSMISNQIPITAHVHKIHYCLHSVCCEKWLAQRVLKMKYLPYKMPLSKLTRLEYEPYNL
jgi:hypothetical protein